MTASKILFYLSLCFIAGIAVGSFLKLARFQFLILGLSILSVTLISVFWPSKKIVIAGFCLLSLTAGILRHQMAELKSDQGLADYNGKKVVLMGIVASEPDIGENGVKLKVQFGADLILVTTAKYPEYGYGDRLKISGLLEEPPSFDGFNYKDYLKKDGIRFMMRRPEIGLVDRGAGNEIIGALISFKGRFQEGVSRFIPPPQSGFLEALVFGEEDGISQAWKDKLNITGTRHIAAVSGMNITILSSLVSAFFLSLGFWRKQAFFLSLFFLFVYILMIGAPPSAVRAGVMGGFLILAQYFGRLSLAARALVFAAVLMLSFNPFLLKSDVGFQLSFLAALGMIYLQPVFTKYLKFFPDFKLFPLKSTLAATFAAQVFTLPILVFNFGYIPLLSPFSNIIIVPFLAPVTILIFIFGVAVLLFWPLGYILSFPVWFVLAYITNVVDFFSKLPSTLQIENASWIWLIISYIALSLLVWRLNRRRLKFLGY